MCDRVVRLTLTVVLLGALILASSRLCVAQESASNDAFRRLNGAFRQAYAAARTATLSKAGPVVVARGDDLTLIRDGEEIAGSIVDRAYHDLKTVSHVPLAIYCALAPYPQDQITDAQRSELTKLRDLSRQVYDSIDDHFSGRRRRGRQRELLNSCMDYLDHVLETSSWSAEELDILIGDQRRAVVQNAEDAARLRIENYHRQAIAWRAMLPPEQWSQLRVVVVGAALPRKDNLAVQYFARLLGERGEGDRIIYAESRSQTSQALDSLGTHVLDSEIGVAFFDDPWRMRRDLLSTGAARYLDRLDFDQP